VVRYFGQRGLVRDVETLPSGNKIVCVTQRTSIMTASAFYYYEVETAACLYADTPPWNCNKCPELGHDCHGEGRAEIPLYSLIDKIDEGYPAVRMEAYE
jgi:hypothetical protein